MIKTSPLPTPLPSDSLIYELPGLCYEDVWRIMLEHSVEFDLSNFPEDTACGNLATNPHLTANRSKIDKMKVCLHNAQYRL